MENAADALKMAAAVLIFVLALSISINAFSEVRLVSRTVLEYNDREYEHTYIEDNEITKRIVGIDSIIPTIYKAYKENYKIVFENVPQIGTDGVFRRKDSEGELSGVYSIDLESSDAPLGSNKQKEQFLMAVIYGNKCVRDDIVNTSFGEYGAMKTAFENNLGIYLNDLGIYDKIKDIKLEERVGIYYQEEAGEETQPVGDDNADVPDVNKTIKRVITYTPAPAL